MRIEGSHLVNFSQRQPHFPGQRCQVGGGQLVIVVLDQMQVLDQQIVSSWPITEKGTNVFDRPGVGLAPLWVASFAISGIKLRGPAPAQGRIGIKRFVSRLCSRLPSDVGPDYATNRCRDNGNDMGNEIIALTLAFARPVGKRLSTPFRVPDRVLP